MMLFLGGNERKDISHWKLHLIACFTVLLWSAQSTSGFQPRAFSNGPKSSIHSHGIPSAARASLAFASSTTTTSNTALSAASTERSCIELTDPETGCQVVLVGCFHGSPTSAQDVEREVQNENSGNNNNNMPATDVIVLELCATRFAGLLKATSYNAFQLNEKEQSLPLQQQEPPKMKAPGVIRFLQNVGTTIEQKGLSTGVASGILGGVSGLQTALSGFTPGLEFTTALKFTQQPEQNQECDIILADQLVDETIEKIGKLPSVVRGMIDDVVRGGFASFGDSQWSRMARALKIALAGDSSLGPAYQVNVGQVMTRNAAVIQEGARLMIPPVLMTQLTLTVINQFMLPMNPTETSATSSLSSLLWNPVTFNLLDSFNNLDPAALVLDAIPHVLVLSFMLTMSYAFLAVPVTQVILYERDEQLMKGIQSACRLAASKHSSSSADSSEEERPGRVVAVLGLLHINGVAQRLLQATE